MSGPYDAVYIPRQGNEQSRLGELLDRPLDHLSNGDIRNLQEPLLKNRWSKGQLKIAVERKIARYPSLMYRAEFPVSRVFGQRWNVLVREVRYLSGSQIKRGRANRC